MEVEVDTRGSEVQPTLLVERWLPCLAVLVGSPRHGHCVAEAMDAATRELCRSLFALLPHRFLEAKAFIDCGKGEPNAKPWCAFTRATLSPLAGRCSAVL